MSRLVVVAILLIICSGPVTAGEPASTDWDLVSPSEAGLDADILERLQEQISAGAFPNVHAVLIVRSGMLGFEQYTGDYGPSIMHYTASVSKSVGSVLFGQALDAGKIEGVKDLGLDTPLWQVLPDHSDTFAEDTSKHSILLRHVLTMSSGIGWDESTYPYSDPRNDWNRASRSEDPVAFALSKPLANDPGKVFNYNGGMAIILSYLIQRGTGEPADEFAKKHLFGPLGIDEFEWERLPSGLTDTDGGLHLRPRDMAKIGQLFLRKGMWNGKRIVSEEWVRESTRVHVVNDRSPDYGFQWWCGNYQLFGGEVYTFLASGHGGQRVYVFPSLDMVAVIANQVFENPMGEVVCDAVMSRFAVPAAEPSLGSPGAVEIAPDRLAAYTGRWGRGKEAVSITLTDGVLRAEAQGAPAMELVPAGSSRFVGTAFGLFDVYFTFGNDDSGKPTSLNARFGFRNETVERSE